MSAARVHSAPEVFPQTLEAREKIAQECQDFAVALARVADAVSSASALYRQPDVAVTTPVALLHRAIDTLTTIVAEQPRRWRC